MELKAVSQSVSSPMRLYVLLQAAVRQCGVEVVDYVPRMDMEVVEGGGGWKWWHGHGQQQRNCGYYFR